MTCGPESSGIDGTWAVWAQGSKDCFTVIQRVVSSSRPRSEDAEDRGQALGRRATEASAKTAAREGPCDLYMAGKTPCVAAHSLTRALFGACKRLRLCLI